MTLSYQTFVGDIAKDEVQKAQLMSYQDYEFFIPYNANYFKGKGAHLVIRAVAGSLVMDYTIDNDPLCFHIWGM